MSEEERERMTWGELGTASRALAELSVQWLFVGLLLMGALGAWRLGLRRFAAYGG